MSEHPESKMLTLEGRARLLVKAIYEEHIKPAALGEGGAMLVESIPSKEVRKIAMRLINEAIAKAEFKDGPPS